jgi:excisionase family DNA binding protein
MVVAHERPARLITLSGAARYLGVSRDLIRHAVDSGQLSVVELGQRRLISTRLLDSLLSQGVFRAGEE